MRKCIRFKMTRAGRRCAEYTKGFGELGDVGDCCFGDAELGDFGARVVCTPRAGLTVREHLRSCPRSPDLPRSPKYRLSREKAKWLGIPVKRVRRRAKAAAVPAKVRRRRAKAAA